MDQRELSKVLRKLYSAVDRLEKAFPDRRFTLDGHLVGSLGEVIAARLYNLDLLRASSETHDAKSRDGRLVQIKLTQGRSVALRRRPQHLLVLKLERTGRVHEVYNGPGARVWTRTGPRQSNGQRAISLALLKRLMQTVADPDRLPKLAG